jgi:hypothetical protein
MMINIKHEVKSRELKRIFEAVVDHKTGAKLFFTVMSKISKLYGLTQKGNVPARVALYQIVKEIEHIKKTYSSEIDKQDLSLSEFSIKLATEKSMEMTIGNPINYAMFDLTQKIDNIYKYDYLVFMKTGKKNKTSISREYLKSIKALLAHVYSLNINNVENSKVDKKGKELLKLSLNYSIMPEINKIA